MARRRLTRRGPRAGFTMIEMLFTVSILGVVLIAVGEMGSRSSDAFDTSSTHTLREQEVQRALERVVTELTGAASTTFLPDPSSEFGASDLSFRRPTSLLGGTITWSAPSRLVLSYEPGETNDGLDEDGDGLADEMRLELVVDEGEPNERRVTLLDGIAELGEGESANLADDDGDGVIDEPGFCVWLDNDVLLVQITALGRVGEQDIFTVTRRTRTELRN